MRRRYIVLAMGGVVLASPVLSWFVVGDTSEANGVDHMFRAPDLPAAVQLVIGLAAVGLAVTGAVVVVAGLHRGLVNTREVFAAAPLVAAGVFVGLAARVMTAGVIGANIGGGLVLLFGPFVVVGLVALSVFVWRSLQ